MLISTDKAVRPSNVMGASKRLAELVVQATAQESANTSLRWFDLATSGFFWFGCPFVSSSDRFWWTDNTYSPRNNTIFMTIPEAAQLVLQASVFMKAEKYFFRHGKTGPN